MYRYNTIQYNTIQPYFRLNLSVLDIHLTGVSDSPEGTNRQLLCRTYALSDHFNCSPLHRRQSWGLGCRDTPDFGLGSSEGSQGASWTGRETLLYLSFIYSFIPAISIAPLQVLYYLEALPTTARILYRSSTPKRTGNCRYWTSPRSLRGG